MTDLRRNRLLLKLAFTGSCFGLLACSSEANSGSNGGNNTSLGSSGTAGMNAVATAGSSGSAGAPVAVAGSGGTAGSAGAAVMAGAGGTVAQGGSAGAAGGGGMGMLPDGCEELGSPGTTGRQCDPGTDDNGTHEQPQPANGTPPEAQGDPAGTLLEGMSYDSTIYGYAFSYSLYVPPQYEAGKAAALMIFQDGGLYTGEMRGPTIIDNLIDAGEIPVNISAYIEPTGQRSVEYDTRSDKYGRFITEEFIPDVIASQYDIVDDPNGWAIGGHSSGGSCAFNVAWFFPDLFHKVITHNGSFVHLQDPGDDEYINLVLTTMPLMPLRVTMESGTNDLGGGTWEDANNSMAQSLETAGYAYRYMHSTTSHNLTPFATSDFPEVLRWLWRGYTLPQYGQ